MKSITQKLTIKLIPFAKWLILGISVSALSFSATPVAASSIWAPSPLAELIEEGLQNNNELQGLKAKHESLIQEISYAGALEDPRIGIAVLNLPTDSFDFNQEPMTQKQISIAQKVPWFGKRSLKSQGASFMADRQKALLEVKRLELSSQVASTYYELGFINESLAVNQKFANLLDQMLRVAETKYSSGKGMQQNVLQAQVEQSLLLEEKIVLQNKQRILQDTLNGLLNREIFSPVSYSASVELPDISLNLDVLQEQSLSNNPWILMKQAEVENAKIKKDLARMDYLPNMDFKASYGQRDDDASGRNRADFFSVGMTFTVPLWKKNRQDAKLAAEQKAYEAAEKNYNNLVASLPHKVDALVAELNATKNNYFLYKDALIIQAEQWASSALSGYEVGKVSFDTMISAQIRLLRLELKAMRYMFTFFQKRAELEKVIGGPIDIKENHAKNEALQHSS